MFYMLLVAMATTLLGGCFGKGTSADPPTNFMAVAGDGRVILTWDPVPSVDFWIFTATNPGLTAFNWTGLPNAHAYIHAATPYYMCGLYYGSQYYFAANGRTNGGPGGASSPTISAIPYNASAGTWTTGTTSPASNLLGVGYTSLTTCSNNTTSAAGTFAAVGASGAIFTSPDGITWTNQSTPAGFATDLYAVTGYAANQNNPTTPNLHWVAVGDAGGSVYSTDGITWTIGGASTLTSQPLRSITQSAGRFIAVGDAGTILSSTDGNTWTSHSATSGTTNNLNGVTHGTYFVAVGDSGTIVTSVDGYTWTLKTSITPDISSISLRQVAYHGSIIVAVGDSGTIVTSKDNGATWTSQTPFGTPNLVGVAAETQVVENAVADPQLGYIATAQFVAVDSNGNTYTSQNGFDWSASNNTGISTNSLVSSGFGYVSAGNAGAISYAF